jgi:uncharacterized protein RhaS with RHS repeats
MYQPELGRFFTQDRFAEKYFDLNPYHYAANNPVLFIDVNGDSLNVSQLQNYDADASKALTSDLAAKTGLTLTTDDDGNVTYAKNDKGKPIVARDKEGKKVGSRAARRALIKIINSDQTISVAGTSGLTKTDMDGRNPNLILFNPQQTQDAMNNTSSDLNKTTNGYALTFFHEIGHTKYGGAGQDPPFVSGQDAFNMPGRQENLPNRIRRQLGSDYGQRSSYNSWRVPGVQGQNYFPWGPKSLRQLKAGNVPTQKFIVHPWGK